jgi:hypothetical protein
MCTIRRIIRQQCIPTKLPCVTRCRLTSQYILPAEYNTVPFVLERFRLEGDPESARNLHKILKRLVPGALERLGALQTASFGICYDSPNVMILTRKFLSGQRGVEDGADPGLSIVFAYGCICHALANAAKDV